MPNTKNLRFNDLNKPSELARYIEQMVKKANRYIMKWGDVTRAKKYIKEARQSIPKIINSVTEYYARMTAELAHEMLGEEIENLNDKLRKISEKLSEKKVMQEKRGSADISTELLANVEACTEIVSGLRDLFIGIENGEIEIVEDQNV